MRALTIVPGQRGSARVRDIDEPASDAGSVLVATRAIGICGTDREITDGAYGAAPPGEPWLVLGHESIGEILEAPPDAPFSRGDAVVGIVRHPDPVPCLNCAVGEWDMCRNGLYTERGIRQRHGFGAERYRSSPEFLVPVDASLGDLGVLLEPASVVAKAWEHVDRIGERARFAPHSALVTGAGPIGLLAAMIGVQRGLAVHVVDRVTDGPKPGLVRDLGAVYHASLDDARVALPEPDVVIECTGAGSVVFDAIDLAGRNGVVCLTGLSSGARTLAIDAAALNRELVLENRVVFGSVNANRRHYEAAAAALARGDRTWLARLITRRVPLDQFADALTRQPGDVKVVIELASS